MPAVRKRTLKALAGVLVAAALVVAPLVTAGASATPKGDKGDATLTWPADTVGEKGDLEAAKSDGNHPDFWEGRFAEFDAACFKHDRKDKTVHGSVSADKKTVKLAPFQNGWEGDQWVALIINAANSNSVVVNPVAGTAYASPGNNGGNQADVSHWIVCKGTAPDDGEEEPGPKVVTPTLTWTPSTCKAEGTLTKGEGVVWTPVDNEDGTTTWTASPEEGTIFDETAQDSWVVPNLAVRTDCEVPAPRVERGAWKDGTWACGDTTVTQTREVVTTTYSRNDKDEVVSATTKNSESQTRPLTEAESKQDCEPTPTPTPTPTTTPVAPAGGTPASTDAKGLAVTGGGISPMFAVAGGAVLFAGISVVAFAAYRRRQASAE